MVRMEHPNGCVHNVRDELIDRFKAAGWVVKGENNTPPIIPDEPKKRKTTKAKK